MNNQMTDFALGGKCGFAVAALCWCSSVPSASEPNPMPVCWRNRRREGNGKVGCVMRVSLQNPSLALGAGSSSINVHELVEAQQHLTEIGQRLVQRLWRRTVTLHLLGDKRLHALTPGFT